MYFPRHLILIATLLFSYAAASEQTEVYRERLDFVNLEGPQSGPDLQNLTAHGIEEKLTRLHQEHLLYYWDLLSIQEKAALTDQIQVLSIPVFSMQQTILSSPSTRSIQPQPVQDYTHVGSMESRKAGEEAISRNQVACLIVAGGQGSRLGYEGPKGTFPVTPIKQKSLFQMLAEKTLAATKKYKTPLQLAIMTSQINHDATVAFFQEHEFFGLEPSQVRFFSQDSLPLLDAQGNLFLESMSKIASGPDGNGSSLYHLYSSDIWAIWQQQGIKYITFIFIDNPLADPFDAELIGHHVLKEAEVTLKCILRADPNEKVGLLARDGDHFTVLEYSEVSQEEKEALQSNGTFKYPCAHIGLYCFSSECIEKMAKNLDALPLHSAYKAVPFLNAEGYTEKPSKPNAWKFERFIFDNLAFSDKTEVLVYPRQSCLAPLKGLHGEGGLELLQKALLERDREILESLTGQKIPEEISFELSQDFYYPTPEVLERCTSKDFKVEPGSYVSIIDSNDF